MKRTVILSTNDNPDYLNYLPYVIKAWNKVGWGTVTFYTGEPDLLDVKIFNLVDNLVFAPEPSKKYRIETITQVARLFAHKLMLPGLLMTSDCDMIPISNYWNPSENEITCYGYDLTGRKQIPMCYIAASAETWQKLIPENSIQELLDKYPNALPEVKETNWEKWWSVDQEIITERILNRAPIYTVKYIDRGFTGSTAKGRVDRYDWNGTLNATGGKIDAHMPRPFNKEAAELILSMVKV